MLTADPTWVECPTVEPPYPSEYVEASNELLRRTLEPFDDFRSRALVEAIMPRFPEHVAEAEAIGREVGVSGVDLFLGVLTYDLIVSLGCSTMALATEHGPVLARNMDWFPEQAIARASCILATSDHARQAGFVGHIGVVTGLSDRGFAVCLNAVGCTKPDIEGYPMLLFMRTLLDESRDFDDALRRAMHQTLASAGIITLVGRRNEERAVVERTPSRAEVFRPVGGEPVLVTNQFRALESPGGLCSRFARLCELVPNLGTDPDVEELLNTLTDDRVMQEITAQHVWARPATDEMRLFVPARLL